MLNVLLFGEMEIIFDGVLVMELMIFEMNNLGKNILFFCGFNIIKWILISLVCLFNFYLFLFFVFVVIFLLLIIIWIIFGNVLVWVVLY